MGALLSVVKSTPEHVADAQSWLVKQGVPAPPTDMFSSTGYVVPGVAAVWLYLTDSTLAIIEMLVGNPAASRHDRGAGLDAVVERAIAEARASGARLLMGTVQRKDVEARAVRLGFSVHGSGLSVVGLAFSKPEEGA